MDHHLLPPRLWAVLSLSSPARGQPINPHPFRVLAKQPTETAWSYPCSIHTGDALGLGPAPALGLSGTIISHCPCCPWHPDPRHLAPMTPNAQPFLSLGTPNVQPRHGTPDPRHLAPSQTPSPFPGTQDPQSPAPPCHSLGTLDARPPPWYQGPLTPASFLAPWTPDAQHLPCTQNPN